MDGKVVELSTSLLSDLVNQALDEFEAVDVVEMPPIWVDIYKAIPEYISQDKVPDQRLFLMIEGTNDPLPDYAFRFQRMKQVLLGRLLAIGENTDSILALTSWFDRTLLMLIEKSSGNASTEHSLLEPYETIFWYAREGIYISTIEGRFIHCNEALVRMFKYDNVEDLLNLDIRRDLYVDFNQREVMVQHLKKDGFFDQHEFTFRCSDGTVKTALESCYLVKPSERKTYIVGLLVDITEEKTAQEKARAYQNLLETQTMEANLAAGAADRRNEALFNLSDNPTLLVDAQTLTILNFNQSFQRKFQIGRRQIGQAKLKSLFSEVAWQEIFGRISAKSNALRFHIRDIHLQLGDAEVFYGDLVFQAHTEGRGTFFFVQLYDNSGKIVLENERDLVKQNVENLFEKGGFGIVGFDHEGKIRFINKVLADNLGYSSRKVKDPSFLHHVFRDDQLRFKINKYLISILKGRRVHNFEMVLKTQAGKDRYFLLNTVPWHFEKSPHVGFLAILTDISRQKELEFRLKRAAPVAADVEELRAESERKIEILRLAHEKLNDQYRQSSRFYQTLLEELKNPVNVVLGFCSLLHQDLADNITASQKEDMEIIHTNVSTTLAILEKASFYHQLENCPSTCKVERRKVPARTFIDGLFEDLKPSKLPLSLSFQVDNQLLSLDKQVETDPAKVESLLRLIVENAVKFTPSGLVQLVAYEDNGRLILQCRDSGIGIPHTDQLSIFQPFTKAGNVRELAKNGVGLGLAIAHKLAELLDSRIELSSKPKKGSVFMVDIGAISND